MKPTLGYGTLCTNIRDIYSQTVYMRAKYRAIINAQVSMLGLILLQIGTFYTPKPDALL